MGQWACESWTVCAMLRYTTLSIMKTNAWIVITSRWKPVSRAYPSTACPYTSVCSHQPHRIVPAPTSMTKSPGCGSGSGGAGGGAHSTGNPPR